jgi:hypothetical protein
VNVVGNIKALIFVLMIAGFVFWVTKPICLRFMAAEDWTRRRNVWLALTVIGFLSPNFWLYAICAIPLMAWAGSKDSNPVALYLLLLFVVQPDSFALPSVAGMNLLDLDNSRLLALAVLTPAFWRMRKDRSKEKKNAFASIDLCVVGYIVLQTVLNLPYNTITNILRGTTVSVLDALLVYYAVSRTCVKQPMLADTVATFCLAAAILAPIGMFEMIKSWSVYSQISSAWGAGDSFAYLMRGDLLRARASTGHALALGNVCAIALGFWMYLATRIPTKSILILGGIWFWMGLIAAYSRAPWLEAVLVMYVYLALSPQGIKKLTVVTMYLVVGVVALMASPFGDKFIDSLPFIGSIDSQNVTYRQLVAERSWEVIQDNLLFGDVFFLSKLEDLRQGQGIIDLVNAYTNIALQTGLFGFTIFYWPFVLGLYRSYRVRNAEKSINEESLVGLRSAVIACTLGYLFFIGTAGMDAKLYIWLGLLTGFSKSTADAKRNTQL